MAVDDFGESVGEVGVGVDAAELAGFDQRGDNRPVAAAAVRAGEESILAIEGDRANGTLDGVRVDLDPAVVEEPGQALLTRQRIADRLGELALLADERELGAQPRLEVGEDWARALLPSGAAFLRIATANVLLDRIQRGDALERLAVTIAAFASRQIQTLVPSISSSIEWGREIARSEGAACNEMRSPSAASTTAGTNGGASVLASNRRRASRRQANNCCGEIPCRRATSETTTPGAGEASIARAFSSSHQRRRPPPPATTSIRRPAAALSSSSPSSLDTSRSPNHGLSIVHRSAKLKVGSKQRLPLTYSW